MEKFIDRLIDSAIPRRIAAAEKNERKHFAFVAHNGRSLNEFDVGRISAITGLTPIFPVIYRGGIGKDVARKYARALSSPVFYPRTRTEAVSLLSDCAFAISEVAAVGILSILAGTRSYLFADARECAELLADLSELGVSERIVSPYRRRELYSVFPTDASASDFCEAEKKLRAAFRAKLLELN